MRENIRTIIALGAAALVSLAGSSSAFATQYPGTICIEDGADGRVDYHASGLVENDSTSANVDMMCGLRTVWNEIDYDGIIAAPIEHRVSPLGSIKVRVYDGSSAASVQCTATRRRMYSSSGGTYFVESSTDSSGTSVTDVLIDTLNLPLSIPSGTSRSHAFDYYHNVHCVLPKKAAATSKIYAIDAPYTTLF